MVLSNRHFERSITDNGKPFEWFVLEFGVQQGRTMSSWLSTDLGGASTVFPSSRSRLCWWPCRSLLTAPCIHLQEKTDGLNKFTTDGLWHQWLQCALMLLQTLQSQWMGILPTKWRTFLALKCCQQRQYSTRRHQSKAWGGSWCFCQAGSQSNKGLTIQQQS